jgi:hypothetical protein
MTDVELFERQSALQAQAAEVIEDLRLIPLLRTVGEPSHTGSSALGLMVARDIDFTTLVPTLDRARIFDVGRELVLHHRVRRSSFRNDTGHWNVDPRYPDGLYWMIEYVADPDIEWTLDLWFLRHGTTQFDLEHMRTLPARLTPDIRAAILRIKEAVAAAPAQPRDPSYVIYEAVLDHGVRTPEEYAAYVVRAET